MTSPNYPSGVKAILGLLWGDSDLLAVVPRERVMAGKLPLGTPPQAISVMKIAGVKRSTVRQQSPFFRSHSVQVSALADSYLKKEQILFLVENRLSHFRGSINGVAVDSIISVSEGPDLTDDQEGLFGGSLDFIVNFNF